MATQENCPSLNLNSSLSQVKDLLEKTFFNPQDKFYGDYNFGKSIWQSFKKTNAKKYPHLLLFVYEKELELETFDLQAHVARYEIIYSSKLVTIQIQLKLLSTLWNSGDLNKFYHYATKMLDQYLAIKNHQKIDLLSTEILKLTQIWLKPHFSILYSLLQCNQLEKAIEKSENILTLMDEHWDRLENKKYNKEQYHQKLFQLIQKSVNNELIIEKYCLRLKLRMYHLYPQIEWRFTKEELSKYFILYREDATALAGILPLVSSLSLADELKMSKSINIVTAKKEFPQTYHQFKFKPQMVSLESIATEPMQEYSDYKQVETSAKNISDPEFSVKIVEPTAEELKLVGRLKSGEFSEIPTLELFYTFESLQMYEAAKVCLENKDNDKNQLYLFCEMLLRQGKYLDCISEIDSKILSKFLSNPLPIEFKYQKAEALRLLGKTHLAHELYMEVALIDPDYRSVRERI